ncbi:MAG: hypothetical protein WCJ72_13245 [Chryseobacterium sp.]
MKLNELIDDILALDSFYNYLSWYERCWLHLFRIDKVEGYASPRIASLANFVHETGWKAPSRKPGQDKLGYYFEDEEWHNMDDYPKDHPEITEQIKNLTI